MVYATAARKTLGYMIVAAVLGLTVVTFLNGDLEPTAQVIATADGVSAWSWITFALGLCAGALMVGTYVHVARIEREKL